MKFSFAHGCVKMSLQEKKSLNVDKLFESRIASA